MIGAVSEEELGEISFVRLEPIQAVRGDGADVEAIDVHRVGQIIDPGGIGGQGRSDESLPDGFDHVLLRALDDRDEREHVLFGRDAATWRVGVQDHRSQVGTAFFFDKSRTVGGGHVGDSRLGEILLDHRPSSRGHLFVGEGCELGVGVLGWQGFHGSNFGGNRFGDLLGVPRCPDA